MADPPKPTPPVAEPKPEVRPAVRDLLWHEGRQWAGVNTCYTLGLYYNRALFRDRLAGALTRLARRPGAVAVGGPQVGPIFLPVRFDPLYSLAK